jgi:hypothetical protein
MTGKKKTPMSDARKALFAEYPWCDEAQAQGLHLQALGSIVALRRVYNDLPFTGDDEHDGNLILRSFLDSSCPEKQRERELRTVERHKFMCKHRKKFQQIFDVPLSWFWDNVTEFDVIKFDADVVQSPDGVSTKEHIRARWGDEAVVLIEGLIGPAPQQEQTDEPAACTA